MRGPRRGRAGEARGGGPCRRIRQGGGGLPLEAWVGCCLGSSCGVSGGACEGCGTGGFVHMRE